MFHLRRMWMCVIHSSNRKQKQTPWSESASDLYRPSDLHLSAKLMPTFEDKGCCVVDTTDPYSRILAFLYRSRYFFFQVAHQFYPRGWVDPIPDPLLLRKSGSAGNRSRTSGSVARNSDHWLQRRSINATGDGNTILTAPSEWAIGRHQTQPCMDFH
jgi:hypothetical protein